MAHAALEIANVYGVRMPKMEGRAGMVALLLRDPGGFDARAFYEFTEDRLPHYAISLFVRLVEQADMTSTFKLRKVDLQRDGYDLERAWAWIAGRRQCAAWPISGSG